MSKIVPITVGYTFTDKAPRLPMALRLMRAMIDADRFGRQLQEVADVANASPADLERWRRVVDDPRDSDEAKMTPERRREPLERFDRTFAERISRKCQNGQ